MHSTKGEFQWKSSLLSWYSYYIHITLNSNNLYVNQNIVNIIEEKKNNKKNPISGDAKYNITVNKIGKNNDKNSTKERNSIREQNKNQVIKKVKRDLSAKPREDNFIFNKILSVKEKNNSNYTKRRIIPH